ncbi:hypothetical protein AAVH_02157 [Aphelenchoides avenae]|nr:hypothetical protein AAVH_02157 [Aphelenchus avenae]
MDQSNKEAGRTPNPGASAKEAGKPAQPKDAAKPATPPDPNVSTKKRSQSATGRESSALSANSQRGADAMPMEAIQHKIEERGFFDKLRKITLTKMKVVKPSELPKEYMDAVHDIDNYKETVCELCSSVMGVLQQNPKHVPEPESRMKCESPPGKDPFEELERNIHDVMNDLPNPQATKLCADLAKNLAAEHRMLQERGRHAMHYLRTYINIDYDALLVERQRLMKCHSEADYARHVYTNDATDTHRLRLQCADKLYQAQMDKVLATIREHRAKRDSHSAEIIKVLEELRRYHDKCAAECAKVRPFLQKPPAA